MQGGCALSPVIFLQESLPIYFSLNRYEHFTPTRLIYQAGLELGTAQPQLVLYPSHKMSSMLYSWDLHGQQLRKILTAMSLV